MKKSIILILVLVLAAGLLFATACKKQEEAGQPPVVEDVQTEQPGQPEQIGQTEQPEQETTGQAQTPNNTQQSTPTTPETAPKPAETPKDAPKQPDAPAQNQQTPAPTPETPANQCTLSVRCDTILQNITNLTSGKEGLVPANGMLFATKTVEFNPGDSVFNLLQREMKRAKIHMEFKNTPIYNSAYIQGIGNLYEFDCGELSGWMYKVNGVFPNFGSSKYTIEPGDKIEWIYTCDLGRDIGGGHAAEGQAQ